MKKNKYAWSSVALALLAMAMVACAPTNQPTSSVEAEPTVAASTVAASTVEKDAVETVADKLNVNEASKEELIAAIPDLGEKMADEFDEYQPYGSRAQFRQEIGKYVDEAQLDEYEKYVFVPLNINNASQKDFLATVPGLGEKMAHEFEGYRPYNSIVQFRQEMSKYVDADLIAEYEKYIFVPVHINEADEATIQETLNVGESVAAKIVAARPYDSSTAFLDKLAAAAPDVNLELVESYLVQ